MKKFCIKKIFISFFIVFCLIQCVWGLEGQVICGIGTEIYSNLYIGQLVNNSLKNENTFIHFDELGNTLGIKGTELFQLLNV